VPTFTSGFIGRMYLSISSGVGRSISVATAPMCIT
jgi:hypothetical protein